MANYLNNRSFLAALIEYRAARIEYDRVPGRNSPEPRIPNYIGECVYLICTRMARRSNFCGYTYVEEMCGDAIENCVRAIRNFDPAKSNNPFGYFSRIAWRAFIRRIDAEKEQTYVKLKNFENLHVLDQGGEFHQSGSGDTDGPAANRAVGNQFTDEFIRAFEARRMDKTKRRPPKKPKRVKH